MTSFTLAKVTHKWSTIMDKPLCTLLLLLPGNQCEHQKWSFLCITPLGGLQWWVKVSGLLMEGLVERTNRKSFHPPPPEHLSAHICAQPSRSHFPSLLLRPKSQFEKFSILIEIINPFYSFPDFHFARSIIEERAIESLTRTASGGIQSKSLPQEI